MITSPTKDSTRFGLLRHGKTVWNAEKRIQGRGDSALTQEGAAVCKRWGWFLGTMTPRWQRIIVSPLQRALDSAAIVNKSLDLPVHRDAGLVEQDWGRWEGLTLAEIKTSFPGELENQVQQGWDLRAPGGESRREVRARVNASLEAQAARWPGENLLVVTHLGVIKTLLYHIEGRDYLPEEGRIVWKNRFNIICRTGSGYLIEKGDIALPETP